MPILFDPDGRGPSARQLLVRGSVVVLATVLVATLLMLKSTGRLDNYVPVVAELNNVGDGLPQKSDVKFRGVLVGAVDNVTPAVDGKPNFVRLNLKPDYAGKIPATVTARVVPSNIFAVSSVQLVDRGAAQPIRAGTHIPEDTSLPTVLFQSTVTKLRNFLTVAGRGREDPSVGVLEAVGAATDHRRVKLLTAGAQLNRLIAELNDIVSTDSGPSTITALVAAANGLQDTAPDLVDALHEAVKPMKTLAEKRAQLRSMVTGASHTIGTSRTAIDNHIDQMITISSDLGPALGVLAKNRQGFPLIASRADEFARRVVNVAWDPEKETLNVRGVLSLTPTYTYTRADCPRYGELKGPSCFTAPEQVVRPDLPDVLLPQNYQPPPDLAPPAGTTVGPDGNLIVTGPPYLHPDGPNLQDQNPPLPWWQPVPVPRVPGTADPDLSPSSPPGQAPDSPNPVAPASFGGNVGPVGSAQERAQLSLITGKPASAATQLLLGPVARGNTVSFTPAGRPQ